MEQAFTIGGILKESYGIIKPKFWTVIGQYALIFFGYLILSSGLLHVIVLRTIVVFLYLFIVSLFSLSYAQKGSFSFEDITRALTLRTFCYYVAAAILFGLAVFFGLILLIVPGIIFGVMMTFYKFIVLDKGLSPVAALKESIRITKGYRWKIFLYFLLAALIGIAGILVLFVGTLFAIPLVTIGYALMYKKLSNLNAIAAAPEIVEETIIIESAVV